MNINIPECQIDSLLSVLLKRSEKLDRVEQMNASLKEGIDSLYDKLDKANQDKDFLVRKNEELTSECRTHNENLARLLEKVDKLERELAESRLQNHTEAQTVRKDFREGNIEKILAIKRVHELTGLGLREAKDFIDAPYTDHEWNETTKDPFNDPYDGVPFDPYSQPQFPKSEDL